MLKRFLQRHALWVASVGVLVPLGALLGMQYFWLVDLEKKSAIADKVYLQNYLEAVSTQVEYFYQKQAERALNLPGYYFASESPKKVASHFKKKLPQGADKLFVVNFSNKHWYDILVFDPETTMMSRATDLGVISAVTIAAAPYKILSYKSAEVQGQGISVEEKDPENRILINPVTDDSNRVLGVVGMIIDSEYFTNELLPWVIDKSLPNYFDQGELENLLISVYDDQQNVVLGTSEVCEKTADITGTIPFVFSDWTLALSSRHTTPEEWARSNFMLNISLSALLALALIGGLTLALRTASREIKLSRMKSDFVSNVSHELRTPLASIRVFGEFLRLGRARDPQKTREYGEYIETESQRLTQLINNILDFSKIESEAKTYSLEPANLEQLVSETLKTLQLSLKHQGFRLIYEPAAESIPEQYFDADAMGQALSNLVDNAVKYSGDSREITVGLKKQPTEIQIYVQDSGIGISREEQSKIFERFHRVSTGLVHDVKGSGLGLSIVSHIVQAHGGRIRVTSSPGEGSTFTIHLPLHPVLDGVPAHEIEDLEIDGADPLGQLEKI